jgi:hypothetical protein
MLWFVGQLRPVEIMLRAVLIYFVRFAVIFFTLFLVKLVLWVSLLFVFNPYYKWWFPCKLLWCSCRSR